MHKEQGISLHVYFKLFPTLRFRKIFTIYFNHAFWSIQFFSLIYILHFHNRNLKFLNKTPSNVAIERATYTKCQSVKGYLKGSIKLLSWKRTHLRWGFWTIWIFYCYADDLLSEKCRAQGLLSSSKFESLIVLGIFRLRANTSFCGKWRMVKQTSTSCVKQFFEFSRVQHFFHSPGFCWWNEKPGSFIRYRGWAKNVLDIG